MVYSLAEGNCLLVAGGGEYVSMAAVVKAPIGVKAINLARQWSKEGCPGEAHGESSQLPEKQTQGDVWMKPM